MNVADLRKYISWNIISLLGYGCSVVMFAFIIMYILASSQLSMRADLDRIFYHNLIHNIILPYLFFYKTQVFIIAVLLIGFFFEQKHYKMTDDNGLVLFENNEVLYSKIFLFGLVLNILPMYLFSMFIVSLIMKIF